MPLFFLLSNFSLVLFVITLLYPREVFPLVFPLVFIEQPLFWLAVLLISLTLVFVRAGVRPDRSDYRSRITLVLFFLPLFGFIWAKMPLGGGRLDFSDIIIIGFILTVFVMRFYKDRKNLSLWGINKVHFMPAVKMLWIPTAISILSLGCWALITHNPVAPMELLKDLAKYPFYAFAQLFFFLAFPVACLKTTDHSQGQTILAVSGLFALIHWPNTVVMLACFLSMAIWAWVYLRYPNLFAVAIAMGLSAAVFGQALPYDTHHNVGVGPDYAYRRLIKMPPEIIFQNRIQKFNQSDRSDDSAPAVDRFCRALNTPKLSDFSQSLWSHIEKIWGRQMMTLSFLRGAEVRREWPKLVSWPIRSKKLKIKHDSFFGYFDGGRLVGTDLLLSGWIANVKTGALATSVHIFINGKPAYAAPPNHHRDDVSRAYQTLSEKKSGFRFKLPAKSAEGIEDLRIFARAESGIFYEIFYKPDYKWLNLFAENQRHR